MNGYWTLLPQEENAYLPETIDQATRLAKWLIEQKGKKRPMAYFIAGRKYNVHYSVIRHAYQLIKQKQLKLL